MILLSIYIYNWIENKFLQLTSPSPYKYSNSINKTNQAKIIHPKETQELKHQGSVVELVIKLALITLLIPNLILC